MDPWAGWYVFWLGLAAGITVLVITAYLSVSPRWLRWLLVASGGFTLSRYVTMALFATHPDPASVAGLWRCWFATSVGLTFPGIVAMDQLVRHPAMTPKKLLQRFSPFLAAYAAVLIVGQAHLVRDPLMAIRPQLVGWARVLLVATQLCFVAGFLGLAMLLIRKIPMRPIQIALGGLMVAYASLGVEELLAYLVRSSSRPFPFSDILALLALWFAFHTAHAHSL